MKISSKIYLPLIFIITVIIPVTILFLPQCNTGIESGFRFWTCSATLQYSLAAIAMLGSIIMILVNFKNGKKIFWYLCGIIFPLFFIAYVLFILMVSRMDIIFL
jgi:ABC-type uncharacterized transport system permease subunit